MYDTTLSQKNMPRIWGYAKRKIKDAHPKKVCHMLQHVKKKVKRIKDAYPKKVCHMLMHAKKREKKKEKIAPYPKRKKKREIVHTKEFIHHPPKISTHLHILIKVYDLFLLWIRSLI
jgi:hypothetical protein